jgi:predicted nucleotidyltransferase
MDMKGENPVETAGIVCEYNPFHAGHRYQLRETRRLLGRDAEIVCLMSGNYVQRGQPAIYDKWFRAETAVRQGADLVLELPLTIAVNAAGYFASGAVDCFTALGCLDHLVFGCESGDTARLKDAAKCLCAPEFDGVLREKLAQGVSYARAREQALTELGGDGTLLQTPNNALGIDYLRRLLEGKSNIRPMAIPRDPKVPSASDIREKLESGEHQEIAPLHTMAQGEKAMLAVLRTLPDHAFACAPFGGEGLWSKVMKASRRENSLEEILMACKSKRYAYTRLRRMLLCLYLGLSREDLQREIPYLRVLAFNDRGREVLHRIKKTSALPLTAGPVPRDPASQAYFRLESRATDLYSLFAAVPEPVGREQAHRPRYVTAEHL